MIQIIIITAVLFLIELFYFKIADKFNIIDKPNERSSHTEITIRGGGILFPLAWIIYSIIHGFAFPFFTIGIFLIATISFLDDRMDISSKVRLLIHLIAFTLCFIELNLFLILPWWSMAIIYIVSIGCVNAINFMDGINGITGLYSLAILMPVYFYFFDFNFQPNFILIMILSLLVFGFFNFRKKAKCFAGDVGSVSMGYFLIFLILGFMFDFWKARQPELILENAVYKVFDFKYILFLFLYGLDSILTIVQRLFQKENIFKAHRKHLYQLLANEFKMPHLIVAILYAAIQFLVSIYIISNPISSSQIVYILLVGIIVYILLKIYLIRTIQKTNTKSS